MGLELEADLDDVEGRDDEAVFLGERGGLEWILFIDVGEVAVVVVECVPSNQPGRGAGGRGLETRTLIFEMVLLASRHSYSAEWWRRRPRGHSGQWKLCWESN